MQWITRKLKEAQGKGAERRGGLRTRLSLLLDSAVASYDIRGYNQV